MKRVFAASLLVTPLAAAGAQPSMQEFARGIELAPHAAADLYRLDVPDDVYRTVTRADLGDLRLFNAAGRVVPHALRRVEPVASAPAIRPLPLFPLYGPPRFDLIAENTRVEISNTGTIVEVVRDGAADTIAISGYLLDAAAVDRAMSALEFDWQETTVNGFLTKIDIDGSNDLRDWHRLATGAPLAELRHANAILRQTSIAFAATHYRYLRVTWPLPDVGLRAVRARIAPATPPPVLRWLRLTGSPEPPPSRSLRYDTGGVWPIERLGLDLQGAPQFFRLSAAARAHPDASWQSRYTGMFYRLSLGAEVLELGDAPIAAGAERYWRVEFAADAPSEPPPPLRLGYRAHELTFLGRGPAPYTLAYGRAGLAPSTEPLDPLLAAVQQRIDTRGTAIEPGAPRELAGQRALQPQPATVSWRKMALWAGLVVAVLVLATLAVRLYREIEASRS